MTASALCQELCVTVEELFAAFDEVQKHMILQSLINLDYENQQKAKDDVLEDVVGRLSGDGVLRDLLLLEERPQAVFLCHARREIALKLVHKFGFMAP